MSSEKKSPPWEDALILALRDLQWIVQQQKISGDLQKIWSSLDKPDKGKSELSQAFQQKIWAAAACPPLLAKLDGAAENASGDVITSAGKRFYLFEFKSTASFKGEEGKFVFELLKKIQPSTEYEKYFLRLSRRGHHVLYPDVSYDKYGVGSEAVLTGFLPLHKVTLQTRRYFDALVADDRPNQDPQWYAKDPITAKELMWGNQSDMGLDVAEMAAYLMTLSEVHQGGEGAHPMKVVIASPDGFLWPCGDLADLLAMAQYFDDSLRKTPELSNELTRHRKQLNKFVDDYKQLSVSISESTSSGLNM